MELPEDFTPEEALERLRREFEIGGDEAIDKLTETEPFILIAAVEQSFREEEDFEGLENWEQEFSEACREAVIGSIEKDGFANWHRIANLARAEGEDITADRIENFIERMNN